MDHSGKDLEKGQRGSSAKNDDVDVIWQATRSENGLTLRRTHSRVRWVPETVAVAIHEDPVLRHVAAGDLRLFAAGTSECAAQIDDLGLPVDVTVKAAQAALKDAGHGTRRKVVCDALRHRRESSDLWITVEKAVPDSREPYNVQKDGNHAGNVGAKTPPTSMGTVREPSGTVSESLGAVPPLSIAEPPRTGPPQTPDDLDADSTPTAASEQQPQQAPPDPDDW
jgi:hypothetical protein